MAKFVLFIWPGHNKASSHWQWGWVFRSGVGPVGALGGGAGKGGRWNGLRWQESALPDHVARESPLPANRVQNLGVNIMSNNDDNE